MIVSFKCNKGHEWIETSSEENPSNNSFVFNGQCEVCEEYAIVAHDVSGKKYVDTNKK